MYLYSLLIILEVFSMSLSYDIELQGILKLGDEFYSSLSKNFNDIPNPHGIFVRTKGKLPKKFSRSSIMRATSVWTNRSDDLMKYVDHIKKKGVKLLKDTGKEIMNDLVTDKIFTDHIANITEEYLMTMQNYTEFMAGKKEEFVIDEEFSFLDMVDTACKLIYRDQKKILNKAIFSVSSKIDKRNTVQYSINDSLVPQIKKINQKIFRQSITTKREEMRYVCYKYEICRYYPALTDYVADFIVEIRKLPDNKIQTFMKVMKMLFQVNQDFFQTICDKEDMEKIAEQMTKIFSDVYSAQDALSILRAVLTQRFKIIHSPDLKLKMKTNGVRILIDIINKAYEYERDDLLAMEFDSNVKAIRNWATDERILPESLITELFNNIVKTLEYNLSKNAKKEIAVLIEMIMKGSSKNEEMAKSLFRGGSKYVRGEDLQSDLEIL